MKLLVCIKEVPDLDPEAELKIDESSVWISEDDSSRYMMNRFDEFAVEEALLVKEKTADTTIDIITVGPERAQAVIRRALGMGADHGIHLVTEGDGYLDPLRVSAMISAVAAGKHYDLILAGAMSEDVQQGQTGVMVAERLGIPWATSVIQQELATDLRTVRVERELEGGLRDIVDLQLPCLLTVQSGINQPRYPSLSKVLRAKKAELERYHAEDMQKEEICQSVATICYPRKQRAGKVLTGSSQEKAEAFLTILKEKSFIL